MLEENETSCDELKMFKISKNNCEEESRSLVYKIQRLPVDTSMVSTESSISSQSDDSKSCAKEILQNSVSLSPSFLHEDCNLLSFDSEVYPEDIIPANYAKVEMPDSPVENPFISTDERGGRQLRRSSRIRALLSNSSYFYGTVKEEPISSTASSITSSFASSIASSTDSSESFKVGRYRKRPAKKNRKSNRRKLRFSAFRKLSKYDATKRNSAQKGPHFIAKSRDPKLMELKSMLLIQKRGNFNSSVPYIRIPEEICPKFANVEPAKVISTYNQHPHGAEFASSKKPMAFFFIENRQEVQSFRYGNYRYYLKKIQRDKPYLRKKYPMLDLVTLDNCYAMSGNSLRKTESLLRDMIAGKEMAASKNMYSPILVQNSMNFENGYEHYLHSAVPVNSMRMLPYQDTNSTLFNTDELFRTALVQAMEILYSEEAVSI